MLFKVSNGVMAGLFLFAAALQFNDPDPFRWIAIYGAAAVPCWLALRGTNSRPLAIVIGVVAAVWSATHIPHVLRYGHVGEMLDQWQMKNEDVVYARELFGLLIVAIWMVVLARFGARSDRG